MRTITENDIRGLILIGNEDEREDFFPAVIGLAKDGSHVAYSREKLEKCFMEKNGWSLEEAIEWVDYNVERALPYYGNQAPALLDCSFISSRSKKYEGVKLVKEE